MHLYTVYPCDLQVAETVETLEYECPSDGIIVLLPSIPHTLHCGCVYPSTVHLAATVFVL